MDCLEESEDVPASNIYILPPDDGNETEADSDQSDDEHQANINNLPRGILSQECEMVYNDSHEDSNPEYILPLSVVQRKLKDLQQKDIPFSYQKSKWHKDIRY